MEAFVSGQQADKSKNSDVSRISDLIVLKAIDKGMRAGIHRCLHDFLPSWRIRPLKADEQRYLAPNSELPPSKVREGTMGRDTTTHIWREPFTKQFGQLPQDFQFGSRLGSRLPFWVGSRLGSRHHCK